MIDEETGNILRRLSSAVRRGSHYAESLLAHPELEREARDLLGQLEAVQRELDKCQRLIPQDRSVENHPIWTNPASYLDPKDR